jgi:hypothetical protein
VKLKTYTIWFHEIQMFTTDDWDIADTYYNDLTSYLNKIGQSEDFITMSQLQGEQK